MMLDPKELNNAKAVEVPITQEQIEIWKSLIVQMRSLLIANTKGPVEGLIVIDMLKSVLEEESGCKFHSVVRIPKSTEGMDS